MDNTNLIPEISTVKQEIIDAINSKSLVIFVGAGVSRLAGCKSWNDLAKSVVYEYFNKKIITICYNLLEKAKLKENFYNIMKKAMEGKNKESIYKNITKLSGICVTTNADELFHDYFEKDRISRKI